MYTLQEEKVAEVNCHERNLATYVTVSSRDNFFLTNRDILFPRLSDFWKKCFFIFFLKDKNFSDYSVPLLHLPFFFLFTFWIFFSAVVRNYKIFVQLHFFLS